MLAKPVTGWENRLPSTTHYHNCCRKAITNLYKFRPQIYPKKYQMGKKNSPSQTEAFNCAAPFLHAIPSVPVSPAHSQKMPASGEAMCGQDFQPLTAVLVLSCFLKRLDWLIPLLFCSSLFLSQPSRKFGVGSISLPPPVVPLQAGKIVCHSLTRKTCHFKAFAV